MFEREKKKNQSPLISVVMPTYNSAQFLGEAIQSVLNQSYGRLELLIIDNFSEDCSSSIIRHFQEIDDRIECLEFANKGIIAAARNVGIGRARGEYVAFLDSDDIWHPLKLEAQSHHLERLGVAAVGCDATVISDTPFYRESHWGKSRLGYVDYAYPRILAGNPVVTSSVVASKHILEAVGGFDENPDFRFIEDWELWLRIARLGAFRILGRQLVQYRVVASKTRDQVDVSRRLARVIEKQLVNGYATEHDVKETRSRIELSIANALLRIGDRECRRHYSNAFWQSVSPQVRSKAAIGHALSLLPSPPAQAVLRLFYRANRVLSRIACGKRGSAKHDA